MSSKGTIFLTNRNEHVYDDTNDWSIVLEIDKESIEKIIITGYDEHQRFIDELDNYIYIIISTYPKYNFTNLYKNKIKRINDFSMEPNSVNCIYLDYNEIKELETESMELKKFFDIRIYLKKDSEWFKEYYKKMLSAIKSEIEMLEEKEYFFQER